MLWQIDALADYHLIYCVARHVIEREGPTALDRPGRLFDMVTEELGDWIDGIATPVVAAALADAILGPLPVDWPSTLAYRLAYISAGRALSAARHRLRFLDPDDVDDVAEVCGAMARDLRGRWQQIDPELAVLALEDAMRGRRPRL